MMHMFPAAHCEIHVYTELTQNSYVLWQSLQLGQAECAANDAGHVKGLCTDGCFRPSSVLGHKHFQRKDQTMAKFCLNVIDLVSIQTGHQTVC